MVGELSVSVVLLLCMNLLRIGMSIVVSLTKTAFNNRKLLRSSESENMNSGRLSKFSAASNQV